MSSKQGVPLLNQLDDDEVDSDDELDFDPIKIRLRVPKGVFAHRSSKRGCLAVAIVGCVVSLIVLIVVGAFLGISFAPQSPYAFAGNVTKSPQDSREYRAIELNTDLRVLVISDPTTDISAAAMDVAVGSFSDTVPGLAHFCEHMLFYSSKKYPVEDEYSDFLSRNGGYENAYTSTENTNYYFRVNADALSKALDRFAQFFIAPNFPLDGVNREMNAVNAEHLKNLQSDGRRVWQLLRHLSNPQHPFHNFSTGDLQTLNRSDILSKLTTFYRAHYSSNQMQLVIYGREDTDTLANYALNMFSAVPNTNKSADFFSDTSFPPPKYEGKLVYYEPVADKHTLSIYWQVGPQRESYLQHAIPFLNSLIGDEGPGSIIDYLRQNKLATDLSAGLELQTESYSLMVVEITLTVDGVRNVSDVMGVVMQYVTILRNLDNSTLRGLWDDYIQVSTIKFDYAAKTSPSDYVSKLASNMRIIEFPQDYLLNPRRFIYDAANIRTVLNDLLPFTPIILFGSPLFKPNATFLDTSSTPFPAASYPFPLTEPIYGTRYNKMNITSQLSTYWSTNKPNLRLAVPGKNQYIPKDLSLLPVTSGDTPIKVIETIPATSVWWSQSSLFREPKVHMYCDVTSPTTTSTPQWAVLSLLYTQLVSSILLPTLYPATNLGYSFTFNPTTRGVSLHLSGFSDVAVMNQLLTSITQVLTNQTALSQGNSFSLSMEALTTALSTYNTTALPYRYVYQYIQQVVMERPYWKHWQLLAELNKIKSSSTAMATLLDHLTSLYGAGSSVTCFLHGNIAKDTAVHHSMMVSKLLNTSSSPVNPIGQYSRHRLPLSPANYSVVIPSLDPNDQNSVINMIFQIGTQCVVPAGGGKCSQASLKSSALLGLLSLQIKQSCFDVLRTQQQLGYAVFCLTLTHQNINSFQFIIQSGTYNASTVLSRINKFLQDSLSSVQAVAGDSGKFRTLQDSYRIVLNRKPVALSDAASNLWSEISTGRGQFDLNAQLAGTLNSITGNELSSFYSSNLLEHQTAKKLVIAVYGKNRSSDLVATFDHVMNYTTLSPSDTGYP